MELERIVSRLFQLAALVACLCIVNANAWADVRVLFRFVASGHHVHSLTKAPTRQLLRKPEPDVAKISSRSATLADSLLVSERISAATAQLRATTATLLWFDSSGAWLSNSEVPDPRVAHAPAHIDGVNQSQVGLYSGAWLATGPDEASEVTILFPANAAVALGFEQWHAVLSRN